MLGICQYFTSLQGICPTRNKGLHRRFGPNDCHQEGPLSGGRAADSGMGKCRPKNEIKDVRKTYAFNIYGIYILYDIENVICQEYTKNMNSLDMSYDELAHFLFLYHVFNKWASSVPATLLDRHVI